MASFIVTFTQIIALVRKELLALIKEPASRALLIAPAFLQALLYGYGATYDLTHVPYAVLDQSRSAASTELLARLDGTGVFVRAATLTSPRQIAEMVDAEKALLVLSIPPDFAARLGSGQPGPCSSFWTGATPRRRVRPPATSAPSWPPTMPRWAPVPQAFAWNGAPGSTPTWSHAGT
jgi:hypothetical protein